MEKIPAPGYILTGGESRRMGEDKGRMLIEGRSMVERISSTLNTVLESIYTVGGKPYPPLPHLEDIYPNRGPLGGLYTALHHTPSNWLFVTACDVPMLPVGVIESLWALCSETFDGVIPFWKQSQFLIGFYNKRIQRIVERTVQSNDRSMKHLISQLNVQQIPLEETLPLFNINTPPAYQALLDWIQQSQEGV